MIRILFLASPIFVCLFWFLTLNGNRKTHSAPRSYLAIYMLLPLITFLAHFFYFAPVAEGFYIFDILMTYAGSLTFPMYHVYFRLLTVDAKFSFRRHYPYMIIPVILATLYTLGVIFTPADQYRTWLFNKNAFPDSTAIQFLNTMRVVLRVHFLLQVIYTIIGNYILIRNNRVRAEQFYSDVTNGKYRNVKILNSSIIFMGVASFAAIAIGRHFLMPKDTIICVLWTIFSAMLYIMGYMGILLLPINPTYDATPQPDDNNKTFTLSDNAQKKLLEKLELEFEQNRIYLNRELNILDLVQILGTNRTYISSIINQQFNQNFCSFVNSYRIAELENVLLQNRNYTNEVLAEVCGFGSLNSMRRAVLAKTGLNLTKWKQEILNSERPSKVAVGAD